MTREHSRPRGADEEAPLIVITGFMGTGKTTVGRSLANMLGLEFVDTDTEIERAAGGPIGEIFEEHGEERFREMEHALCVEIKDKRGAVIATGGGTLLDDANLQLFAGRAEFALLEAPVDTLVRRLRSDASRPLLAPGGEPLSGARLRERIEALLAARAPVYDRIERRIDTSGRRPTETAAAIAAAVTAAVTYPHRSLSVNPLPHSAEPHRGDSDASGGVRAAPRGRFGASQIDMGRGVLSALGSRLRDLGIANHAFVLIPEVVERRFGAQIGASLDHAGVPFTVVPVRDGDPQKNMGQASAIIDRLVDSGAHRDSTVVPVGGGVTGDIGGFVASIFMRGVPLVHVPTTLLAQVDSSIGGKVGVNHARAKNLIGSFYQPHLVLSDPCTLRTLPLEEISNGMAEVVKSALIGSEPFYRYLEAQTGADSRRRLRDIDFLERCVFESARIKCRIVNEDPFENDRRRTLNLGHTVGHALEASAKYLGLKHGEAVSLGLIAALRIGVDRGTVESEILEGASSLLAWCGLPVQFGKYDREAIVRSLQLDKKIKDGKLHFVLPVGVGDARIVSDVTAEEILSTIEKG